MENTTQDESVEAYNTETKDEPEVEGLIGENDKQDNLQIVQENTQEDLVEEMV